VGTQDLDNTLKREILKVLNNEKHVVELQAALGKEAILKRLCAMSRSGYHRQYPLATLLLLEALSLVEGTGSKEID
jgi:hypothetical protein